MTRITSLAAARLTADARRLRPTRKNVALGLFSLLAFSCAATPLAPTGAWAADEETVTFAYGSLTGAGEGSLVDPGFLDDISVTKQSLDIPEVPEPITLDLETFDVALVDIATVTDPADLNNGHHFDVAATIAAAYAEVGTSRPTGWSMPGECIAGAKRWILAGGGAWTGSGSPVANYVGATRVDLAAATPGDVIQYTLRSAPNSWAIGVHTLLITGVNSDGSFQMVEQNNPAGSGLVSANDHWTPSPPSGFDAVVWRF
ncbi:hypothetical protein GCM10022198_25570 [Klugiella xanthotipulae]|uniref:lipase n=1 Tax=Klugiella xanthotipulae TaxID=244735 RepID=UPI001150077F|nr:lipase [Klugiella xanthotipulae]